MPADTYEQRMGSRQEADERADELNRDRTPEDLKNEIEYYVQEETVKQEPEVIKPRASQRRRYRRD